ncbi:MAG: hypothetical protein KC438_01355 [Thermomicrobiales bacterium]|nr:hypothetical protein [Thermomicrobiales bacterium]MCO5220365.1 hypothetical protein [Thermomicrobiales bacterium]
MRSMRAADPLGLGRSSMTRWLPVFWLGPAEPPAVEPFPVKEGTTPKRFLLSVIFSEKRYTSPCSPCSPL